MNKMAFKIRVDSDNPKYEKQEEIYRDYLKKIDQHNNPDLLTYFGNDFFADGNIENLTVSDDFKTLSFRILCPNIRKITSDDDWHYVNAWFKVTFRDVVYFTFESYRIDKCNNPLSPNECSVKFMASEINTLRTEIKNFEKIYKQKFNSLIIDTLPTFRSISIISGETSVEAEEPLAFSQLLKEDDYDVPIYEL